MIEHFQSACLSQPVIFCETPVGGGPDCSFYALAAYALSSLLPQLEKIGVTTAAEVDVGTLCHRLRHAVTAVRAQVSYPMQVCGWTQC